jgi:hypothetical protein
MTEQHAERTLSLAAKCLLVFVKTKEALPENPTCARESRFFVF